MISPFCTGRPIARERIFSVAVCAMSQLSRASRWNIFTSFAPERTSRSRSRSSVCWASAFLATSARRDFSTTTTPSASPTTRSPGSITVPPTDTRTCSQPGWLRSVPRTDAPSAYTGNFISRISSRSRQAALTTAPARPRVFAARLEVPPSAVTRSLPPASITSTSPRFARSMARSTAAKSPGRQRTVNAGPKSRVPGTIWRIAGDMSPRLPLASYTVALASVASFFNRVCLVIGPRSVLRLHPTRSVVEVGDHATRRVDRVTGAAFFFGQCHFEHRQQLLQLLHRARSHDGRGDTRLVLAPQQCQLARRLAELARNLCKFSSGLDARWRDSLREDAVRLPPGARVCGHRPGRAIASGQHTL